MLIICLSYALYALDALYAWCAWYAWDAWYALCAWYALYCLEFVLFAGLCDHGAEVWPQVGRCLLWLHYSSGQSQHLHFQIYWVKIWTKCPPRLLKTWIFSKFCFLMQWTCYNINWADDDIVSRRSLIFNDFVSRSTPSAKENHSAHRFTSPLEATP